MSEELNAGVPAIDLIESGNCSPQCLLARSECEKCDCVCAGLWHGGLKHAAVGQASDANRPQMPACAWCRKPIRSVWEGGQVVGSAPFRITPYLEVACMRCAWDRDLPCADGDQFRQWQDEFSRGKRVS